MNIDTRSAILAPPFLRTPEPKELQQLCLCALRIASSEVPPPRHRRFCEMALPGISFSACALPSFFKGALCLPFQQLAMASISVLKLQGVSQGARVRSVCLFIRISMVL